MAAKGIILVFAFLICKAYTQIIQEATVANPVVTTIIDNSVSNSLANALQLLIVSNLIQNTMNSNIVAPFTNAALNSINSFDSTSPFDLTNSCDSVNSYDLINFITPFNSIQPCNSLAPFNSIPPLIEAVNYPSIGFIQDGAYGFNTADVGPINYGLEYSTPVAPICQDFTPNYPIINNIPVTGPFGEFGPVLEPLNPYPIVAPVAAEVLFPPSIPAQLRCNFGYGPNSMPCVNVNVEPLTYVEPCPPFGYPPFGPGFLY